MEKLFLRILQMSLSGSVVIAAVLYLRLILRRAPRRYSYLLWSAAAFRLCVPVTLPSPISLFRLLEKPAKAGNAALAPLGIGLPEAGKAVSSGGFAQSIPAPQVTADAGAFPWMTLLASVWLGVLALLLLWGLISGLRLRRRLATAIRLEGNVYRAEGLSSPFLLGYFRPRIYIPRELEGADLEYVLAHERCHLRRADHWLRLLAWFLRCVHWFNPLCWLAWFLMGRDMELSCDEAVLEKLGDVREEYSRSLLHIAARGRAPAIGPAPPAFGEAGVGRRVKNVLRWKKARGWVTVCAVLLCVLFTAAWITDPAAMSDKTVTLNPDGTFGNLEWGMSPEEVLAADNRIEMTESLNDFYAFAELKGARVLGYTADISLTFSKQKLEDGIKRGPDGRPTLDGIHIYIPGEVSVTEALTAVFGEIEKRKPSDNEWDIVDGVPVLHWLPGELPEDKWYWHTDPVYTDIPMEHLRLSIPWYEDATLLGAWCSTFGCKVYVDTFESEEGMTTDISFIGYGYALKRFLAEEYQRMTEVDQDG